MKTKETYGYLGPPVTGSWRCGHPLPRWFGSLSADVLECFRRYYDCLECEEKKAMPVPPKETTAAVARRVLQQNMARAAAEWQVAMVTAYAQLTDKETPMPTTPAARLNLREKAQHAVLEEERLQEQFQREQEEREQEERLNCLGRKLSKLLGEEIVPDTDPISIDGISFCVGEDREQWELFLAERCCRCQALTPVTPLHTLAQLGRLLEAPDRMVLCAACAGPEPEC